MSRFFPYARQQIDEDDVAAVSAVLMGDYLTTGPAVSAFEEALAKQVESRHAVACANGTAALHLAAMVLGIGPGDWVVVPAVTFLSTANAIRFVGGEVVFADVDPDTGLMNVETLKNAVERAEGPVKAVFPVHLNGQCVEMEPLAQYARQHGLYVVEDGCHALGTRYRSRDGSNYAVGDCAHSDLTIFSFHPVKHIAMGEGGAVTCNDDAMAARASLLRNHGMTRDARQWQDQTQGFGSDESANPWYYEMQELGYNYRASDIHCALGLSQLGKLSRFLQRRRQIESQYDQLLEAAAPVLVPVRKQQFSDNALHLYPVLIDFEGLGRERGEMMRGLSQRGIGTQVHYLPINRQPYYCNRYGESQLDGADRYYARTLSIPFYPSLQDADVEFIAAGLMEELGVD